MSASPKSVDAVKPGRFDLSDWGAVSIQGPDAADYLQRMSTVAVKQLSAGSVAHGAFLTGKGQVVGLGMLERVTASDFTFWCSPGQSQRVAAHLEQFHFAENLNVIDASGEAALIGFWREEPFAVPGSMQVLSSQWNGALVWAWREDIRPALIWGKIKRTDFPQIGPWLPREAWDYLRIASGIPQVGVEVSDEIILETGFDVAVARNKGCYPGQEVVERIFTYGSVNRRLTKVEWTGTLPSLPVEVAVEGKVVGKWVSAAVPPGESGHGVGLAYLHKQVWDYGGNAQAAGATLNWKLNAQASGL